MTATVTSFPHSKVAGRGLPLLPCLASLFIYSSCEPVSLPQSLELRAPCTLCYMSFFFQLFVYYSVCLVYFPPGRRSVFPEDYADLSQGVLRTAYLHTWWSPKQVRNWCLAAWEPPVSPFNVVWGCYARAVGVEVSQFCLFLVAFLARCISSISSRVYFRKHAFCFLPLVAILESPPNFFLYRHQS
jgi:hypothetical protein